MQSAQRPEAHAYTLPADPSRSDRQPTGLVCPDCHGTLSLQADGPRRHLTFVCRIGHTYDLSGLLAAKEADLESRAWAAVVGYEEMAALLRDLVAYGYVGSEGDTPVRYGKRRAVAEANGRHFREAIERDSPIRLAKETRPAADPLSP